MSTDTEAETISSTTVVLRALGAQIIAHTAVYVYDLLFECAGSATRHVEVREWSRVQLVTLPPHRDRLWELPGVGHVRVKNFPGGFLAPRPSRR